MGCGSSSRVEALEAENCKFREQLEVAAKEADLRTAANEEALAQRAAKANALVSEHEAERARIKAQLEEGVLEADKRAAILDAEKLELLRRRASSKQASAKKHESVEAENSALRQNLESDRLVAESRLAALDAEKAQLTAEKARCEDRALARVRALEIQNTSLRRDIENYQAEAVSGEAMLRSDIESVREAAHMREEGLQAEMTHLLAELELAKEAASKAAEAQLIAHQAETEQLRSNMNQCIEDLEAQIADRDAAADLLRRTNTQLLADRAAAAQRESAVNRVQLQSRERVHKGSASQESLTVALREEMEL